MNGWAMTKTGWRWHQVEFDNRTGMAQLECNFTKVFPVDASRVMDYRWRPLPEHRCQLSPCSNEVDDA